MNALDQPLPDPPVAPDTDLRSMRYMSIDIVRLFGSRFHAVANDAEWRAGMTLWLKSFHQIPAGSLPSDDIELCRLAEFGRDIDSWMKVKEMALHGWYRCSDNRLYHNVVAAHVMGIAGKHQTFCARAKKASAARWEKQRSTKTPTQKLDLFQDDNGEEAGEKTRPLPLHQEKGQKADNIPVDSEHSRVKAEKTKQVSKPDDIDETVWKDFLALRKAKKAPLTETALKGIRSESEKAGISLQDALRICCMRGWQGFKADWDWRSGMNSMTASGARIMSPRVVEPDWKSVNYGDEEVQPL